MHSEIVTEQVQIPSGEMQQQFSSAFSLVQTQAENGRLILQRQQKIEAATSILPKQELEREQLKQQLNQPGNEIELCNITLENTKTIPSISKKLPPQENARSKFSIPIPLAFHVIRGRQK